MFLKEHHPSFSIPIPVEDIVEFSLKLEVITHKDLLKTESVDAYLSSDLLELHIDEDHYMGSTNRARFTMAHEVGHFVLHKELVAKINSLEEWKTTMLGAGTERDTYEQQANDFAGCLLMPRESALEEFEKNKKIAVAAFKKAGLPLPDDNTLTSSASVKLARMFDVSEKVAEIRISKILKYLR